MAQVANELWLELGNIETLDDDGEPVECACCAWEEGRQPKLYSQRPLSEHVMEVAWPLLETLRAAPFPLWRLAFLYAARAWNAAVSRHAEELPGWNAGAALVLVDRESGAKVDAVGLIAVLAERKRELYPDDERIVADVQLSNEGKLWCKPKAPTRRRRNAS